MATNTDTHTWSACREYETVWGSALNGTSINKANQNPNTAGEELMKSLPLLAEELLTIDGYWGREMSVFFRDTGSERLSMLR